jgi:hypothetical protein
MDRKGNEMLQSFTSLRAIPHPARILVTGLDTGTLPWESEDFTRFEFGDQSVWTVVLPPAIQYRRSNQLAQFADAAQVQLSQFDYVATYGESGALENIRAVSAIPASRPRAEVLVPALRPLMEGARLRQTDYGLWLRCADLALNWGLRDEAAEFLDQAHKNGANDETYARLLAKLQAKPAVAVEPPHVAELSADPAHIRQPDGTGVGITELLWKVPPGLSFEIHVNAPDGPLFSKGTKSGSARTEKWVKNGTKFFLQDRTGGKELTPQNTLAQIEIKVSQ